VDEKDLIQVVSTGSTTSPLLVPELVEGTTNNNGGFDKLNHHFPGVELVETPFFELVEGTTNN
jgi:hypothetical protein